MTSNSDFTQQPRPLGGLQTPGIEGLDQNAEILNVRDHFFIFLDYHLYLFLLLILFGFFPISYRYSCLSLRYLETLLSRLLVLI